MDRPDPPATQGLQGTTLRVRAAEAPRDLAARATQPAVLPATPKLARRGKLMPALRATERMAGRRDKVPAVARRERPTAAPLALEARMQATGGPVAALQAIGTTTNIVPRAP